MNVREFCWSWFEKSGNPSAYMEYKNNNQINPSKPSGRASQEHINYIRNDHF